jgi:hypothetical protein
MSLMCNSGVMQGVAKAGKQGSDSKWLSDAFFIPSYVQLRMYTGCFLLQLYVWAGRQGKITMEGVLYFTCNHDNGRHLDGFATLDSRANSNIAVNKSEFAVTARTAAPLIWLDVDNHIADISHSWGVNVNPVGLSTVLMADEFDMNSHLLLTLILLRYQYWIATMGEWIQPQLESGWSNPNLNFSEIY